MASKLPAASSASAHVATRVQGFLLRPDGLSHPSLWELDLATWRLCGDLTMIKAFSGRMQLLFVQLIDIKFVSWKMVNFCCWCSGRDN